MRQYHFSGQIAKKFGIDEAIFLEHLAYWVKVNTANRRNVHDGRVWTYNTQSAFSEIFDLWTRRQIQRILKSLETQGAIIKGNYNKKAMDRTLWYTVSDEILDFYEIPRLAEEPPEDCAQLSLPIAPNGAMDSTEPCYSKHETVPAIPNNKPDNKHKETLSDRGSDGVQDEYFRAFWDAYPRHDKKKEARSVWRKLNPDEALFHRIMFALDKQLRSPQWRDERNCLRKQYIPLPTSWLRGERWNDEGVVDVGGSIPGPDAPSRLDPGEGYQYV